VKLEPWIVTLKRAGLVPLLPGIHPIACTFCGVQEFPGQPPIRLWNIAEPLDIFLTVGSTLAEQTILKHGYYPYDKTKRIRLPYRRDFPLPKRRRATDEKQPTKTKTRKGNKKKSRKGKLKNEHQNCN
jgi:hypothetical protein